MSPAETAARIREVEAAVRETALRCGRDPGTVRLVGVTKTVPAERVREAYDAGLRRFGENYVQEALGKMDLLPPDAEWHFIGHLQSNKAKFVAGAFALLHTLDRPSLADALEKVAAARGVTQPVLLQANLAGEETKEGTTAEGVLTLARRAAEWPHLAVRGLMALPPYEEDAERSRPHFRALRELAGRVRSLGLPGVEMAELSMGMSHDYTVAIEEGATLVRVGTALFGARAAGA